MNEFDFDASERDIDECIVEFLGSLKGGSEDFFMIHAKVSSMACGNVPASLLTDRMLALRGSGTIIVDKAGKKGVKGRGKNSTYRLRTDEDNARVTWPMKQTS